jgi:dihydroorotate dehydrogenase electron transfer subunit
MVSCGNNTTLPRPFSISNRDNTTVSLLVRVIGKGTEWLSQSVPGDVINMFGPLGNGFAINRSSKNLLLVAGGIGIAPLIFLAETSEGNYNIKLKKGALNISQLYPEGLIPAVIDVTSTTEDGSFGYKGLVTDVIARDIAEADQVFACGPTAMYKAISQLPESKNKPVQVSMEIMMGCGRGICYGCTIKTRNGLKKVCEDGPVFNLNDIIWE